MNSRDKNDRLFLAIPLGVLRRFVEMNKDKDDSWSQLFEIQPENIFSEAELNRAGSIERRGSVVVDLNKLYGGEDAN